MAGSIDTAKELLTFAGGPSALGTGALLAYARKVFEGRSRNSSSGWVAVVAGFALIVWSAVFVVWAAPTVFGSWTADGRVEVTLVFLSITWFVAIGLIGVVVSRSPMAARYLTEAYRDGEGPWIVRWLRRRLPPR